MTATTTARPKQPRRLPRVALRRGLRATTADALLVSRRRAGADVGLLVLSAALLAVTVALALLAPRLLLRSADHAVRESVAAAGHDADVVVEPARTLQAGTPAQRDPNVASGLQEDAKIVSEGMPRDLRHVVGAPLSSIRSQSAAASGTDAAGTDHTLATRLVYVTDGSSTPLVRWVAGRAPAAIPVPPAPDAPARDANGDPLPPVHVVQVGLEQASATKLGIAPGTELTVRISGRGEVHVVVSGLYTPVDRTAPVWSDFPDLLTTSPAPPGVTADGAVGLLLTDESVADARFWIFSQNFTTRFRFDVQPDTINADSTQRIERAIRRIYATPDTLSQALSSPPKVSTTLDSVLLAHDVRQAAGNAQSSVLEVGLAGVGALALVLAARLLIGRRRTFLLAERARGASTLSVALRAAVESVPLTVLAAGLGAFAAWLLVPDSRGSWTVAAAVAVVAALAPPVTAAALVHRAWSGKRMPANRADRQRLLGRRRARRVTVELTLVVIGVAALVSVQRRGLLETVTTHVDLLLAATPLLLAVAATIVLLHVMPPVLRGISRRAQSRRGLVPVVATARASGASGTAVPLLTLTVAVALMVFCGTTVQTVRAGQGTAADAVVGADVRIDGAVTEADLTKLRAAPGVTAVAAAAVSHARSLGGDSGLLADIEAVDVDQLAKILRAHGEPVDAGLTRLAHGSGAKIPALASPSLAASMASAHFTPQVLTNTGTVSMAVAGTLSDSGPVFDPVHPPVDEVSQAVDGRVLVDRVTYDQAQGVAETDNKWTTGASDDSKPEAAAITTVWVDGPGAAAAVHKAGLEHRFDVTTSRGWLSATRTSPLNEALVALLVGTGLTLALFAAMALVLTVVATSGERGRTISALRTLGLDARTARAMTFGELAPLAVAALLAGTLIGVGVPWLLTQSLGLTVATGGPRQVAIAVSWMPFVLAVVVVVVSLVVAVRVESAVRRRDRLGEVLRVGER
jgi:putative ABC transport system permease protein